MTDWSGDDATAPAAPLLNLSDSIRQAQGDRRGPAPKRGRPRNEPTPEKEKADELKNERQIREEKDKRKKEIADTILHDINDQLLLFLAGGGVPTKLLFKEGEGPAHKEDRYGPVGNSIAFGDMQANAIAGFVVALEESDGLKGTVDNLSHGSLGLLLKGVFAAGAVVIWGRNLMEEYAKLKPLIEMRKKYEEQRAKATFGNPQYIPPQEQQITGGLS